MKITKLEIFDCDVSQKYPGNRALKPILLRIHTDEGLTGIGEAGLAYGSGQKAAVGMLRDLGERLIGRDPLNVESIWEMFYRESFWGSGGGPVVYAGMSAVDIACWDIRGKALGVPVYMLLGGKTNPVLRAYASQTQFGWGEEAQALATPEEYAGAVASAMAEGYDCIKVDPLMLDRQGNPSKKREKYGLLRHDDVRMGLERLEAIRDTLGPDGDIILEIHSLLGGNAAVQFGRAVDEKGLNILYYEEPVAPMNPELMATIARKVKTPVASGERIYTRWGYRRFLETQALAVVQPDVCLAGGITETKKICDYANIYDARAQLHVCGSPITTAAALHIETAIPNFIIHEHHVGALKPAIRELCRYDHQPVNGSFSVPELPGLGQEINDAVCKDYLAYTVA